MKYKNRQSGTETLVQEGDLLNHKVKLYNFRSTWPTAFQSRNYRVGIQTHHAIMIGASINGCVFSVLCTYVRRKYSIFFPIPFLFHTHRKKKHYWWMMINTSFLSFPPSLPFHSVEIIKLYVVTLSRTYRPHILSYPLSIRGKTNVISSDSGLNSKYQLALRPVPRS